jgi:hypothetical protein
MEDGSLEAKEEHAGDAGERLESWKEIARFFGRTPTTVQRWEQAEGLPVHRLTHAKKGSVFAFKQELEDWRLLRTQGPGGPADALGPEAQATPASDGPDVPAASSGGWSPARSATPPGPREDEGGRADAEPHGASVGRFGAGTAVAALLLTTVVAGLAWVESPSTGAPPQTPTDLTAVSRRPGSVSLTWIDNSSTETRFEIRRSGEVVRTSAANEIATDFDSLDAGTSYHWDVRACNASGCSPWHGVEGKTPDGSDGFTPPPQPRAVGGAADILFVRRRETGKNQVHVMHADGLTPIRLLNTSANDSSPVWSPDRTKVAFSSDRTGFGEIYLINADGSNQVNLTNMDPAQDTEPTWSPDGTRIAFTSTRSGHSEIWVMGADGSRPTRLSRPPDVDSQPAWSPDGTRIAFQSDRSGGVDIYVMQADGSNQTRLTTDGAEHNLPAWSPNSDRIVYGSRRHGNWEVYVMDADGSHQTNLTNHPAVDGEPSWSPDGTRIAFRSNRDGDFEIFSMAPDGSGLVKLTHWGGGDHRPDWGLPLATGIPGPPAQKRSRLPSQ